MQPINKLLSIDHDIVLPHLIERVFQMLLNIVETDEDQREQYRHDVSQVRREVGCNVCEVRAVQWRQYLDKKVAECTQRTWCSILKDVLDLFECEQHLR